VRQEAKPVTMFKGSDDSEGFLDHGTGIIGELQFTGRLRIDGDFRGSISADGILVIGEKASIHAENQGHRD
jgi:cytoskeletal protein CcmA (bactofilin family)